METLVSEPAVNDAHSKVIELTYLTCTDQNRKLLAQFKSGSNYFLVLCDYDASTMLLESVKNRKTETLKEAALKLLDQEKQKGHEPNIT